MIVAKYPTKKALKDAWKNAKAEGKSVSLRYQETSMFGPELVPNKLVPFVGPSADRRVFYGSVKVDQDFNIVEVK